MHLLISVIFFKYTNKQLKKEDITHYQDIFYCVLENDKLFYIKK